jgi:phytoene/squalene synthetase
MYITPGAESTKILPSLITRAASKQTYFTIRYLVDRDRTLNAYRAYAYFRWVDDQLDKYVDEKRERIAFVERQQALMDRCYRGEWRTDPIDAEQILVDLIRRDYDQNSGLQSYIRNMMSVMVFDAKRRGCLVSQQELTDYSLHLAVAVTEAMHYFIGHDDPSPGNETRYLGATAAHIIHMLRDSAEDVLVGYFNIPREWVECYGIDPCALESDAYREWVKSRVQLAQSYFRAGRSYLNQVRNFRCRIAGYAYIARFESVLKTIEMDDYRLRADYHDCKTLTAGLAICGTAVSHSLGLPRLRSVRGEL